LTAIREINEREWQIATVRFEGLGAEQTRLFDRACIRGFRGEFAQQSELPLPDDALGIVCICAQYAARTT
jgi:hypothetical protein